MRRYVYVENSRPVVFRYSRNYGFFSFLFDLFMIFITCGLWLIWVIIREWRRP